MCVCAKKIKKHTIHTYVCVRVHAHAHPCVMCVCVRVCIMIKLLKVRHDVTKLDLTRNDNETGLGWVIPISFSPPNTQLFPILSTNPSRGRLIGSHPIKKMINNSIPALSRRSIEP